ncbi:organomercurial lyase MerB [Streptomyces sp. ISL-96]|uniref:organomercurial lyase MerB n=1 Tax=Streptomyces sp. ISL-96 TaxID=2819191 RepID=UPI001BE5CAC8|nr:organomercurial lyase MerB [Streptomyces sp. ISL-96]
MDTDIQQFATRFNDSLSAAPGAHFWLLRPLLTLLAAGEPVTVDQLAAAAGRPAEEVRQTLATMSDTEYDSDGRIIGYGITFNPTPHRYETGDRTFYTWCALDTLALPAFLGKTAHVTSPCHGTGEPVRLTVAPDEVTSVEPATAVVSLVTPDAPTSIRSSFCDQSHFFAGPDAARDWLAEHPGARILPVADAYEVGQSVVEQIVTADTPSGCC